MMIKQHPDYEREAARLVETKNYMNILLTQSESDLKSSQANIRSAMANLEYIDSSDSYLNILTNSRFFEMARNQ